VVEDDLGPVRLSFGGRPVRGALDTEDQVAVLARGWRIRSRVIERLDGGRAGRPAAGPTRATLLLNNSRLSSTIPIGCRSTAGRA
jgi:hypothetical protein